MGKTMAEKILSRASGREALVGDVVWVDVSALSMADNVKYFAFLDRNDLKVWNPDRVVFCFDHFMYPHEGLGVAGLPKIRQWAKKQGVPAGNIYDIGRHGLSHQIPAEEGFVLPGTVYAASDTQGATMGALNCFAIASLESTPFILATGKTWLRVPECVRIICTGTLPKGVMGKDIYLRLLRDLAGATEARVIEFAGPGVSSIPMDVRLGVANGANHLGAITVIFPADQELNDYLSSVARSAYETVSPDEDAVYAATFEYDLSTFEPLVAGPDVTTRIRDLSEVEGTEVHAGYIGSCSSGRLQDLALAAEVLRGRKVKEGVRLVVTPISSKVMRDATEHGLLSVLTQAGATITTPGCGACFYGNQSPLALDDGETCITGSTENYSGRMGSRSAKIYLANAAVIAASAIEGRITHPAKYYRTKADV